MYGHGGALLISATAARVYVRDTRFGYNVARGAGEGGALFIGTGHSTSALTLERCVLDANWASRGGALAMRVGFGAHVSVNTHACAFRDNKAKDMGRAVLVGGQWESAGDVFEDEEMEGSSPLIHAGGRASLDIVNGNFIAEAPVEYAAGVHQIYLTYGATMRCLVVDGSAVPLKEGAGRGGCGPAHEAGLITSSTRTLSSRVQQVRAPYLMSCLISNQSVIHLWPHACVPCRPPRQ